MVMSDPPNRSDLLRVKAELLCLGIGRWDPAVLARNPFFSEAGFVHGTQVVLAGVTTVNIAVNERFVAEHSPFGLEMRAGGLVLTREGEAICSCDPVPAARWYQARLSDGLCLGDVVRLHSSRTLFSAPVQRCIFSRRKQKCAFCTFDAAPVFDALPPERVIDAFARILDSDDEYDVALGGATVGVGSCDTTYYAEIVRGIKKQGSAPVSVEIVPPPCDSLLDVLVEAGVDALIMNLEFYDESVRARLCPGKSQIARDDYFRAWEHAVARLGKGRVGSVLIVGLEDTASTVAGCEEMVQRGVLPTLIPFRPYDSCDLRLSSPTSPGTFAAVARTCADMVRRAGLDPRIQPGCTRCGGCSLDVDLAGERDAA